MKPALSPRLVLAAFAALLVVAPLALPAFYVTLLNYIGLYAMVALGLVLLTGVGGLTSFGQAAFVGLGAYTTALLTTSAELPGWLSWAGGSPWLALVVVELLASSEGLGFMIVYGRQLFQLDVVLAAVVVVGIVGYLLDRGLAATEQRLLRWRKEAF